MIENEKDKPSLDELVHYGVKGMRWGHRKAPLPSSSEIKSARRRVKELASKANAAEDRATAPNATAKDKANYKAADMAFLKSPDRATALRLTRGEGYATAILSSLAGPGGLAAATAVVGAREIARKNIERKQRTGAYNK